MKVESVKVDTAALRTGIVSRLYGAARERQGIVVWAHGDSELLLRPERTTLTLGAGWLVVAVEVESDQTGPQTLRLVFGLGREEQADGLRVATTLGVKDPSGLLSHWGPALQEAIWAGILDAIEAGSGTLDKARVWAVQGIAADDKTVNVRFATGGV